MNVQAEHQQYKENSLLCKFHDYKTILTQRKLENNCTDPLESR